MTIETKHTHTHTEVHLLKYKYKRKKTSYTRQSHILSQGSL